LSKQNIKIAEIDVAEVNKLWREEFKKVPFYKRILLVSHCLRRIGSCQEERVKGKGLICLHCHDHCQVNQIVNEAKRLKYKNIYIISGGSVVESILKKERPAAIVAIACRQELAMGVELVKILREKIRLDLPLQIVELSKADCDSGSQVNIKKVKKFLQLKNEEGS